MTFGLDLPVANQPRRDTFVCDTVYACMSMGFSFCPS